MNGNVANQVLPPARAPGDPGLSVHTLGEFLYCPRAGLQSYENQGMNDDDPLARREVVKLNFLPLYDLAELRFQLDWSGRYVLWMVGVLLIAAGLTAVLVTRVSAGFGLAFVVAGGLGGRLLVDQLRLLWFVYRTYRVAQRAGQRSPKDNLESNEPINWWAMLNDGFDSVRSDRLLTDDATGVGGRPWRVLRRGGLRIPVIHLKSEKDRLYDGHYAKVAAYCHLVRVNEPGTLSPYGIILFGDTYQGIAVPNHPQSRQLFHEALQMGRRVARSAKQPNGEPTAPPRELRWVCKTCPWGEPFVIRPGENDTLRFGELVPLKDFWGKDDRSYHSHCGDRFDWLPPHKKAAEKGLRDNDDDDDEDDDYE